MAAKFRLATLLKLRIAERDRRRTDLAQALEAERLTQARGAEIDDEIAATRNAAGGLTKTGQINVDSLLQSNRYELLLRTQRQTVNQQLAKIHEEIERRRLALVEADRQVRVLEKLREKQADAAVVEELRIEAKELDEAALLGFRRREGAEA